MIEIFEWLNQFLIFEHAVRKFARDNIDLYSSKNKSLNRIILDLVKISKLKEWHINLSILKQHKNIRNWLSHSNSNTTAPEKYLEGMKKIDEVIKNIMEWKVKKKWRQ